jgi:peptidoglycan-associated lipoprotein
MRGSLGTIAVTTGLAVLAASACATKSYVREQVAVGQKTTDAKVGEVQQQVETTQMDVQGLKKASDDTNAQLAQLSSTARDALTRAQEAGKLAQGKFLYEVVLTDESVNFPFNSAELSDKAKAELDTVAARLKQDNKNVYVEIQGFTDASGPDEYDVRLGEARAEAVRRYLSLHDAVPLNRMNVISYGKDKPIADNHTRDGRAQNRRVALVVLA